MRVAFHTLGCKVNQYETEAIKEAFVSRGAEIVSENEPADAYIVNTCTVTNMADRKSRQYIRRMKSLAPGSVMVVTGCYAQVAAEDIKKMTEVDMIIGNNLKSQIVDLVYEYIENLPAMPDDINGVLNTMQAHGEMNPAVHMLGYDELSEYEDMGIITSDESSMCRAYIKIEEGCNRFCSYCMIPYARGRVRSRMPDVVVAEAKALIEKGYKEIILTGINTALYGTEPEFKFERAANEEGLSGLEIIVKRIDALDGDFRIRLSSLEPTVVNIEDVRSLLGYEKLCHHLHLSVQSGSDKILKAMNRHYNREEYLSIVRALRDFDPLYGITTDIIVGFPGEKDEDFKASLDIVSAAEFGRVHAFRYSPRKGTAAARLRKGLVNGAISSKRANILDEVAAETARGFNEKNFGVTHRVLAEEESEGYITGYTDNYIRVYLDIRDMKTETAPRLGEFCRVKLTENYKDGCKAVLAADGNSGD
ncbi:MAG: tRNA (N(6)-L-threonylcarbamoyladenosine(37)-C(2))-methylthiotransferase MtaB [Mogibacterium sp.]|nr:tRNA (N(6)-L-threonylcarbamoyladenosine(37)-C(2))-methylthiotransferase MtaB [Mogibacterium sp.]